MYENANHNVGRHANPVMPAIGALPTWRWSGLDGRQKAVFTSVASAAFLTAFVVGVAWASGSVQVAALDTVFGDPQADGRELAGVGSSGVSAFSGVGGDHTVPTGPQDAGGGQAQAQGAGDVPIGPKDALARDNVTKDADDGRDKDAGVTKNGTKAQDKDKPTPEDKPTDSTDPPPPPPQDPGDDPGDDPGEDPGIVPEDVGGSDSVDPPPLPPAPDAPVPLPDVPENGTAIPDL